MVNSFSFGIKLWTENVNKKNKEERYGQRRAIETDILNILSSIPPSEFKERSAYDNKRINKYRNIRNHKYNKSKDT